MGNVIIGQSGGPTAVINASLAGVLQAADDMGLRIFGMVHGIEGLLDENIVELTGKFDEYKMALLKRTPASFLGTCRYKLPKRDVAPETYEKIFEIMEKYDIEYFLYNGGNDSMDTILQLSEYAKEHGKTQKFMGVPKTIDNDLPMTDHTPGFGSAAKFIATAMKEIIRDNECYGYKKPKVALVEIMGRHAGWLTAASALSKGDNCDGPDLILLPELDFDLDKFHKDLEALMAKKNSVVIAVSEGLHFADGTLLAEKRVHNNFVDAFGHKQLAGAGGILSEMLKEKGIENRCIELSVLQRCSAHYASKTDVTEAFNCGYEALKEAVAGETGKMIIMKVVSLKPYIVNYESFDIRNIANGEKKIPREWITEDGTYVKKELMNYIKPLIIGTQEPVLYDGVPVHLTLKDIL